MPNDNDDHFFEHDVVNSLHSNVGPRDYSYEQKGEEDASGQDDEYSDATSGNNESGDADSNDSNKESDSSKSDESNSSQDGSSMGQAVAAFAAEQILIDPNKINLTKGAAKDGDQGGLEKAKSAVAASKATSVVGKMALTSVAAAVVGGVALLASPMLQSAPSADSFVYQADLSSVSYQFNVHYHEAETINVALTSLDDSHSYQVMVPSLEAESSGAGAYTVSGSFDSLLPNHNYHFSAKMSYHNFSFSLLSTNLTTGENATSSNPSTSEIPSSSNPTPSSSESVPSSSTPSSSLPSKSEPVIAFVDDGSVDYTAETYACSFSLSDPDGCFVADSAYLTLSGTASSLSDTTSVSGVSLTSSSTDDNGVLTKRFALPSLSGSQVFSLVGFAKGHYLHASLYASSNATGTSVEAIYCEKAISY